MIEINNKWAIDTDGLSILLCSKKIPKKAGLKPYWYAEGYYPDLHTALQGLAKREIADTNLSSLKTLADKIEKLFALIKSLPNITVRDVAKSKEKGL